MPCAITLSHLKKKKTSVYLTEIKDEVTLRHKADKLYQQIYVKKFPYCLVCNSPTQVIHHYVNKARSNYLRYSRSNAIPLCNECHCAHHKSGDPRIVATIIKIKGIDWHNNIQHQRLEVQELSAEYLREQIKQLEGL